MPAFPSLKLTKEHQQLLIQAFERFKDDIELSYPAVPVFYDYPAPHKAFINSHDPLFSDYSKQKGELLSLGALQSSYEANKKHRKELKAIADSGSSGIGYVLKHPSLNQKAEEALLDTALTLWQETLPSTVSDYALMLRHHELSLFDDWLYDEIQNIVECIKPKKERETIELLALMNNKHNQRLLFRAINQAIEPESFASLIFENESFSESSIHLVKLYIDDFATCDFNRYYLNHRNEDLGDKDKGVMRQVLNARIIQQSEMQNNLTTQLQLQSPLIEQNHSLIRINGPMLKKHYLKSFKLQKHQITSSTHIAINLRKVYLAQGFFDLILAAILCQRITPLPVELTDYVTLKINGTLEIPLCPSERSPLYSLLSQVDCIKDLCGNDKVFEEFGAQFRRLTPEPNYQNRIMKTLTNYLKGHALSYLSPEQKQQLKEIGIKPSPPIIHKENNLKNTFWSQSKPSSTVLSANNKRRRTEVEEQSEHSKKHF